jgi:hypothetical protein
MDIITKLTMNIAYDQPIRSVLQEALDEIVRLRNRVRTLEAEKEQKDLYNPAPFTQRPHFSGC